MLALAPLLQLVVDLTCVEHCTTHCVPLLVDMKIHFALLKLCYGAVYVLWNTGQLLLGFPLIHGIWHSYKYCAELFHRALLPLIKFLGHSTSLQVGYMLPRKPKVVHMEKTLLCLLLSTPFNRARLEERVSTLFGTHQYLTTIQRKGLRLLLALKALFYTYCPVVSTIGISVQECSWAGRGAGTVAKQVLKISLLMLKFLKPDLQLTTEYAKTTVGPLLFWSQWHSPSLTGRPVQMWAETGSLVENPTGFRS